MKFYGNITWIVIFTLAIICKPLSSYADNCQLGINGCLGISNIDYPGHNKNSNFTLSYEIGGFLEKQFSSFIKLGTGIKFQKSGYLQRNEIHEDGANPFDIGIKDYRITLPIELYLTPKRSFPLSLILGIENSFKIKRDYIIKPYDKDYLINFGEPSIYNINFEIGIRGDIGKSLSIGILYKRGLNAVYRHVDGFNLNMITLTVSWWVLKF